MDLFQKSFVIKFFILFGYIAVVSCAKLHCYDGTFENYLVVSLDNPTPILNSSCYKPERETVVYAHGFNGGGEDDLSVKTLINVYLNKVNILFLSWVREAAAGILGPIAYPLKAIGNAKKIGVQFGKALLILSNNGLSMSKVHLIGFSLGAHLMGYAGDKVKEDNKIVKKITCCDAAGPFFDGLISLSGVDASSAEYVITIHTNFGQLGSAESLSTVDIWANCGSNIQPGCQGLRSNSYWLTSDQNLCSHGRSWQFLAESLKNPTAFEARAASDCEAWSARNGTNETIIGLGDIDKNARGNYYFRTDSTSPFGLGKEGSQPAI